MFTKSFPAALFGSAVTVTLAANPVQALPITIDGVTYEVTIQELAPNDLESVLSNTPWWGDSTAARTAAEQVGTALGSPNLPESANRPSDIGRAGPRFLYSQPFGGASDFAVFYNATNSVIDASGPAVNAVYAIAGTSCPSGATPEAVNANLLAGTWNYQSQPGPIINNNATSVDMSAYSRPSATISGLSEPITVTFPDDNTFEFTFCNGNGQNYLAWSNNTAWERNQFVGIWLYQGTPGPVISMSGNNIVVDMSAYQRPNATGIFKDENTIEVTFPDDPGGPFVGVLVNNSIQWSNNTVWTR